MDNEKSSFFYKIFAERFNESELRTFCFNLKIVDYDDLPGNSKSDKARELVSHFERRDELDRLELALSQQRPDIDTNSAPLKKQPLNQKYNFSKGNNNNADSHRSSLAVLTTVIITVALCVIAFYFLWPLDRKLSLDNMPFTAFAWTVEVEPSESGWANFMLLNNTRFEDQRAYYFEFVLPISSTQYSGAGLTFTFSKPQDLTEYSQMLIDITFSSPETRCDFILIDISNKSQSVPLSPNISLKQDIERRRNGLSEIYTIPLDSYFGDVDRKYLREVACASDAWISPGAHNITINHVKFLQ